MDNVVKQLGRMISEQLEGADVRAISLANTLLAQSVSFAHELSNYITMKLAELGVSGFDKGDVWFLVSKLIFHMFAIDFNKVRLVVREGLDVIKNDELKSRKVLARRDLWGFLQTHVKMREYTRVGIKNHPSISLEYFRFLIQKASLGRVAKLEAENRLLRTQIDELEQ